MSAGIQGQIQIKEGRFSSNDCTTENDLIANQAMKPEIRKMLEFKNKRYLMTLLTSGALKKTGSEYFVDNKQKTRIPQVDEGKGIGNHQYRFDVIGRIEKQAVILRANGPSTSTGQFQLLMRDEYLWDGATVMFNSRMQARVMGNPTGSTASGFTYNFQTSDGSQFNFNTDVAGQAGTYTCAVVHSSYSEGSLRGHSRDKNPSTFVNHMTIQRKTTAITGGARASILWYEYSNATDFAKGWMFQKVAQMQATDAIENERNKWLAISSMKDSNGALRTISALGNDPATGLPIIVGDGWEQQVSGSSIMYGSGTDGNATEDDFEDMMRTLVRQSNGVVGMTWVCVTGIDGFANAQRKMVNLAGNQNTRFVQMITQTSQAGGAEVEAGYNFTQFNVNGNSVCFIQHPMLDDDKMFTQLGSDGRSKMSSAYFFMGLSPEENRPTMEILCRNANGVDRSYVEAQFTGMTGSKGTIMTEEDADKYAILREDMFNLYNAQVCGIIYKS